MKTDSPRCYPRFQDVLIGISAFFKSTHSLVNCYTALKVSWAQNKANLNYKISRRGGQCGQLCCSAPYNDQLQKLGVVFIENVIFVSCKCVKINRPSTMLDLLSPYIYIPSVQAHCIFSDLSERTARTYMPLWTYMGSLPLLSPPEAKIFRMTLLSLSWIRGAATLNTKRFFAYRPLVPRLLLDAHIEVQNLKVGPPAILTISWNSSREWIITSSECGPNTLLHSFLHSGWLIGILGLTNLYGWPAISNTKITKRW